MTINASRVTTRRRGRPPAENPQRDRRQARFTEAEGRTLNRWMHENGINIDGEAVRQIVLERLAADGVTDPGADSELGFPPDSHTRKISPTCRNIGVESNQLALTA